MRLPLLLAATLAALTLPACTTSHKPQTAAHTHAPGTPLQRTGDEIVIAGQYFHTGTPVVLWTDPGGYDAYRTERRFVPLDRADYLTSRKENRDLSSPARYNTRNRQDGRNLLTPEQLELVRGGNWPLPLLQNVVDQFVIHYDVCGTSRQCFKVLHDMRGLSVHFMLDIDGTIYQTLDLKERAWHGGTANSRSIGIEIANIGAYATDESPAPLEEWYEPDQFGRTRITIPPRFEPSGVRTPNFVGYPFYSKPIAGEIQGKTRRQYDFTPQQYEALARLTAALCKAFPNLKCDYPKDNNGHLITHVLPPDQLKSYQGLLGHYHVTKEKSDPGPAFQWDLVLNRARSLMLEPR